MADLNKLGLADARDALRKGDVSSAELTAACLSAIEGAGALNAFVHHTGDLAMDQAKAADARIKSGDAPAMCGLPIGIKDLFCTKGVPSQAASRILEGFLPEYESTVSQNLLDSGAVMLGKLNMDEFAMGSSNETSVYGNAVNPWRRSGDETALTPGGSSGGSAAAVAAEDFEGAMAALASLRAPIDSFFDSVTVNDADPAKRASRLALLARVRDAVHNVADFSKIAG